MRRSLLTAAVLPGLIAASVAAVAPPAGASTTTGPAIEVRDGMTQPVFSYADAIRETVFVETPVDSDFDGRRDRVSMRLMRPKETNAGLRVPIILEASPYYAGLLDIPNHPVDIDGATGPGSAGLVGPRAAADVAPFGRYYDNYFLPRGYAVAQVQSLGGGASEGCPTSGGRNETLGIKAVVDWFNGRARAFTETGEPVRAGWSTGSVGMIGQSYNGTLPQAVATTGVQGLKTIVPIAAISSWYDYYRANGAVLAPGGFQGEDTDVLAKVVLTRRNPEVCAGVVAALERDQDRVTGDYSAFWDERNYLNDVDKVRASVFAVHGLNDWNVKTTHLGRWWSAIAERNVPRKIWLHQGAHLDPFSFRRAEWLNTLNKWFDRWLHGIHNDVMSEPMADVERSAGQWETFRNWPQPGTEPVTLRFGPAAADRPGTLGTARVHGSLRQGFVDEPTRHAEQLADNWLTADPNRLAFLTPELGSPIRLSGTPEFTVRAAVDGRSTSLTALLVDYGTDTRTDYDARLRNTGVLDCYGSGVPGDSGCSNLFEHRTHVTPFEIITRGWIDVRNRTSPAITQPIRAGTFYSFTFDGPPKDYVVKAGHRLGVVVLSTDFDYTLRPRSGTRFTVDLRHSSVDLPVVGGQVRM